MGSLNIQFMRDEYPGKSDPEAAKAFAQKNGYIAIVRYKHSRTSTAFTDIGTCQTEEHIRGYLNSPYCHDAEVIYDGRATALRVTEELILRGHCELCGKRATRESLHLMAGNDFYICPECGLMFCDGCYVRLPLTSSPGYGMCPKCRIQVQRAIPGFYGSQSGQSKQKLGDSVNAEQYVSLQPETIISVWLFIDKNQPDPNLQKENVWDVFSARNAEMFEAIKSKQCLDNIVAEIRSVQSSTNDGISEVVSKLVVDVIAKSGASAILQIFKIGFAEGVPQNDVELVTFFARPKGEKPCFVVAAGPLSCSTG